MRTQSNDSKLRPFRGAYLQALDDDRASYLRDGIAMVHTAGEAKGRIAAFGESEAIAAVYGLALEQVPVQSGLYLQPFYDIHFHWVQDDVREMPKASLIEWLQGYTFPVEAKFADQDYAREKAGYFWKRILRAGTVGGLCYSSIHEVALQEALRVAPENFKIGNVLMDMNCPDALRQTEAAAIESVRACAQRYGERYACSPRFAPTTSPAIMRASAIAAEANACFQQTHLDENLAEIEWVLSIYRAFEGFEDVASYTEIYQRVDMLGPKTVFGHCIHMDGREWAMLADSDSVIASCPSSNAPIAELGLGSGLFDYQAADQYGVRWALASDIGGGPFLSMFDVMRSFVQQNREAGCSAASYVQAFYRSSTMGARILGLGDRKGLWAEGYDFDCIRVDAPVGLLDRAEAESILAYLVESVSVRSEYDALVADTIILGESCF